MELNPTNSNQLSDPLKHLTQNLSTERAAYILQELMKVLEESSQSQTTNPLETGKKRKITPTESTSNTTEEVENTNKTWESSPIDFKPELSSSRGIHGKKMGHKIDFIGDNNQVMLGAIKKQSSSNHRGYRLYLNNFGSLLKDYPRTESFYVKCKVQSLNKDRVWVSTEPTRTIQPLIFNGSQKFHKLDLDATETIIIRNIGFPRLSSENEGRPFRIRVDIYIKENKEKKKIAWTTSPEVKVVSRLSNKVKDSHGQQ